MNEPRILITLKDLARLQFRAIDELKTKSQQIIYLEKLGFSQREITIHCHCSYSTITKVLEQYKDSQTFWTPKKCGPKPKNNEQNVAIVLSIADSLDFFTTQQIKIILSHQFNITMSNTLIGVILKENRYKFAPLQKIPKLSKEQKAARVKFAAFWLTHPELIPHIKYSDESRKSSQNDRFVTWIKIDLENFLEAEKYAKSQMFFCVIGLDYKSDIYFVSNHEDSYEYQEILLDVLDEIARVDSDAIFQQDGATIHRTSSNIEHIRAKMRVIIKWPSDSPDLNVIEMVWARVKKFYMLGILLIKLKVSKIFSKD